MVTLDSAPVTLVLRSRGQVNILTQFHIGSKRPVSVVLTLQVRLRNVSTKQSKTKMFLTVHVVIF